MINHAMPSEQKITTPDDARGELLMAYATFLIEGVKFA